MSAVLDAVCIEQNRQWTEHNHYKAEACKGRGIWNQKLAEIGFSKHPGSPHYHAPSKIFHVEFGLINNAKCDTENDGYDSGK